MGEEKRERVEEEDEVVGCCSGYVLRNHQLMQRKRKGLWIGPHQISESSSERSTEMDPISHKYLRLGTPLNL